MKLQIPKQNIGIVLLDDSLELLRVYEKVFEEAGLRVIGTFSKPNDLLSFFASSKDKSNALGVDAVVALLDFEMPVMNGGEVARKLRELNPDQKIILTTLGDPSSTNIEEKSIDAVLEKPFTISSLLETVQTVLSPIRVRGSIIVEDPEQIYGILSDVLSDSKKEMCVCLNSSGIHRRTDLPEFSPALFRAREKGMEIRLITEITIDNLFACKELMVNRGVQLRHLEGIVTNFALFDQKHLIESTLVSSDSKTLKQIFYSNLEQNVGKSQHLFEKLWKISSPGVQKIRELEAGAIPSTFNVIRGPIEAVEVTARMVQNAVHRLDGCSSRAMSSSILLPALKEAYTDAMARGVNCRLIMDISKDTLNMCKDVIHMGAEVRHLPNLKGAFGLNEKELVATAAMETRHADEQAKILYTNYSDFVEQHGVIFDTLWNIATPAPTRIKEVEAEQEIREKT